ncbi:MAG: type I-C CRISPR-associated endonuclease Cas1c [Dehalococcoidia bacterium]|nr:type I-C CRISPR-associated endonuclease Cas1c [Dehalococcoidia bacterium]
MLELQNVLYVVTPYSVLRLDHDAVRVEVEGNLRSRFPLNNLAGIVAVGRVTVTSSLLARCAEDGRSVVWLDYRGRFLARVEGRARGNVLLRRAQHLALSDVDRTCRIARQVVAGKLQNARHVMLRGARETPDAAESALLAEQGDRLAEAIVRLETVTDLETVRGVEGDAARGYFAAFTSLVRVDRDVFALDGRSRRPPRDRMNSLLSFLYALVRSECTSALEGVGLDPQVGYLHSLRPGRPALALDLMEELRPVLADRLALTLVNRRQIKPDDFEELPGGAVYLTDEGRRTVLAAYQRRKEEVVRHRVLRRSLPVGLLPHVQARLLARHLRGDLPDYPPYVGR